MMWRRIRCPALSPSPSPTTGSAQRLLLTLYQSRCPHRPRVLPLHHTPHRHQSSHSSASSPGPTSSSSLPSSHSPSTSSPNRPLSSLAPRLASPPPLPLDPTPTSSHPSPPPTLDGVPIPTTAAGLRALVDRLRPHLYLALSRLPSPSPSPTLSPSLSPSSPSPSSSAPLDWLSSLDLDSILLSTLQTLHPHPSTPHTTASLISLTLHTTLTQHLSYQRYTDHLLTRGGEMERRRREVAKAFAELEKIRGDRHRMRTEGLTGLGRGEGEGEDVQGRQPTLGKRLDTPKTLSIPLHKDEASIYHTRSPSAATPSPRLSPATPFHLYHEQLQLESLALDEAVANYAQLTATLVTLHKGAQLRPAQRMMLTWYSPLVSAIEKEQERAKAMKERKAIDQHLPYLLHLSAPQLAVLTMHTMFSLALAGGAGERREGLGGGVKFVLAAAQIGHTVNMEVKMELMRKDRNKMKQFLTSMVSQDGGPGGGAGSAQSTSPNVLSKLRLSKKNQWSEEVCVKLGAALIQLLVATAVVPDVSRHQSVPAFRHEVVWEVSMGGKTPKQQGFIMTDERVLSVVLRDHEATEAMMPKLKPMIVPPKPWTTSDDGGYLSVPNRLMRSHGSLMQMQAVNKSHLPTIYRGLNYLSAIPWRINGRILHTIETLWARGGGVADLPSLSNVPVPTIPPDADPATRKAVQREGANAGRHNRNLHSLRCDVELKLSVARQFKGRAIYFPFNVDFRGRAYPIPPHLNHIGNDLCRGLLMFEQKKRVGEAGLRWLMIHTTNLWGQGKEKLPYDERVQWCRDHLDLIRRAAADPLGTAETESAASTSAWWLQADKPFQFLAASIELAEAYSLPEPVEYHSALPVHQDGSCNGLQHYAALGRDVEGGMSVNLTPSERPQDVYSVVCARVLQRVAEDAQAGLALAKLLEGRVTRKVVKQTVMTSVYGVTLMGAKDQIKARLLETSIEWPQPVEASVSQAALYLARVTLSSLYSAFEGARRIQDWLGDCALRIASGAAAGQLGDAPRPARHPALPTRRHLRRAHHHAAGQPGVDQRPAAGVGSAAEVRLPPNFIHSLDATHMVMTALRCEGRGADVHRRCTTRTGRTQGTWTPWAGC